MGRIALITGAGQGIGKAIALRLSQAGMRVVVNDINAATGKRVVREIGGGEDHAVFVRADVAVESEVKAMFEEILRRFARLDVLVNNAAAFAEFVLFHETTPEDRAREMVTLLGAFNCTRWAIPPMVRSRWGRIINISSLAGTQGDLGRAVYSAAKAGLNVFTRALAKELGPYGITVNAVAPGSTETPRLKRRPKTLREVFRKSIPLGRFARPEEVAELVAFLASAKAAYITGAVLSIDGGQGEIVKYD